MNAIAAVAGQLGGYRRILAQRDYRLLWSAQVVSTFGDRLTQIALTTLVFAMTGTDLGIGLVLTITVLPKAVFGVFAGALADKVSRKTLLIVTDCVRAAIVLVLAMTAGLPLGAVYLLAILHATATVFFTPTRYAVLPDIIPREELLAANTLDETTQSALDPLAYLIGGALVAALGARLGFAVDSITFLVSAALIVMTTARGASQWHAERSEDARQWGIAAGLAVLWSDRVLRANTLLMLFAAATASAETPLTYMLVLTHWDRGALGLGIFEAVLAIGFVIGALVCGLVVDRFGKGWTILLGLVGTGLAMSLVAVLPFWPAAMLNGLSGVFNIFFFVPTVTLNQERAPMQVRARVMSSRGALMAVALLVSYVLATALTWVLEPAIVMLVMGLVLAAGAATASVVPTLRRV